MTLNAGMGAFSRLVTRGGWQDETVWRGSGTWSDGQPFAGELRYCWDGEVLESRALSQRGGEKFLWSGRYDETPDKVESRSSSETGAQAEGWAPAKDPDRFVFELRTWKDDPEKYCRYRETAARRSDDSFSLTIEKDVEGGWTTVLETVFHRKTD